MNIDECKIEKIGNRGDFSIWSVNGKMIRDKIDIEFTNFGQHFRFNFIPINEFWLDVETEPNERNYFIDHLLVEWKAMNEGLIYEDALDLGAKKEFMERQKEQRSKRVLDGKGRIVIQNIHKKLIGMVENGLSVWLVDGKIIRDNFDIDFTEGGHDLVYDFVPEKEIWIDDDLIPEERPFIILHELHERNLMSKGVRYNDAHHGTKDNIGASQKEWLARQDKNKLAPLLNELGWKHNE